MTFEMTLGLIVFGSAVVMFGLFLLSIHCSAKKCERDLKENLEHMAKVNEMLKEKAKKEGGGKRTENLESLNLSDLWDC